MKSRKSLRLSKIEKWFILFAISKKNAVLPGLNANYMTAEEFKECYGITKTMLLKQLKGLADKLSGRKVNTRFRCAHCGKLTSGRMPKDGGLSGDTSGRFPRRHKFEGQDCPGNIMEAEWVDIPNKTVEDMFMERSVKT